MREKKRYYEKGIQGYRDTCKRQKKAFSGTLERFHRGALHFF